MSKLKQQLALSERLLERAKEATSVLQREALFTAARITRAGGRVPQDIVGIVETALSFNQNRYGK